MDRLATMGKVLNETQRIVDNIEPSQLDDATPCSEWTVRDVLNHITAGADMFAIAGVEGSVPEDKLLELLTGDSLGDDYRASFRAACDRALAAYAPPGALDKVVVLPFGEMPAGVALDIAIFDVSTHAWDLAKATGQSTALDPEVLEAAWTLAPLMLTDDYRAAGMYGAVVEVADDAPLQDKLAAFAGRTP
ncbi:MAG: TIGR03086 family metal-binding protein [Acidimicrobiia bacterium]